VWSSILKAICSTSLLLIMTDEATDVSNKEQLSSDMRVQAHSMLLSKCITGVTGEAIAAQILQILEDWQLSASQLRGQTYNGAGSMAGKKKKGVAARISEQCPKALYTHRSSHVLNLCIVTCCSIPDIRSTECVHCFFNNSLKHQLALEMWITDVFLDTEKRRKL